MWFKIMIDPFQNKDKSHGIDVWKQTKLTTSWHLTVFDHFLVDKVFQIKEDTESMKKKIVSLKAELRKEMKIHDDKGEVNIHRRLKWLICLLIYYILYSINDLSINHYWSVKQTTARFIDHSNKLMT